MHTLHNYRLLCVTATLFRDGGVCEDCIGKTFRLPGMDGKEKPLSLSAGDIVYCPVNKVKTVLGTATGLIGQTAAAAIYVTQ